MTSRNLDTLFDEWSEGRDDVTAIEAVILLDKSGSMSGDNADNAYKSMWAIKKALEKVEARTTVVTFNYETEVLYRADERAGTTIRDGGVSGGTNPEQALLYAQNVFAKTEKPIRVLFMITDGHWDTEAGENAVRKMKRAGVLTAQALIGFGGYSKEHLEHYRHEFEILASVPTAKELYVLGKNLVRTAITRNLVRR
jgi:predicted metal-dependent peptidase